MVFTIFPTNSIQASNIENPSNDIKFINYVNDSFTNSQMDILRSEINEIKRNLGDILPEFSKMKVTLQKLSATMTRQRKRERSKNKEL